LRIFQGKNKLMLYFAWFFVFLLALNYTLNTFIEPEVWADLSVGRYIAQNFKIPHTDIFSFATHNKPYIDSNWLYQLLIYFVYSVSGTVGLMVFKIALLFLLIYIILRICASNRWNLFMASLFTVYFLFCFRQLWILRSHMLGIILFLVLIQLIIKYKKTQKSKYLYWLPLIMVVWANSHPSFIVGVITLSSVILIEFIKKLLLVYFDYWFGHTMKWKYLSAFFKTCILSILITMANPHGYKLIVHAFQDVSIPVLYTVINWFVLERVRILDFYMIIIALIFIALTFFVPVRKSDIADVFVLVCLFLFGYFVKRYSMYPFLYSFIMAIKYSGAFFDRYYIRMTDKKRKISASILSVCAIVMSVSFILSYNYFSHRSLLHASEVGFEYPDGAVNFIAKNKLVPNVYSPFYYGGYMLYKLYPEYRNFIDYHTLFISEEPLLDNYRLRIGDLEWKWFISKYDINTILIRYNPALRKLDELEFMKYFGKLSYSPDWGLAYWDDANVLYIKKTVNGYDKCYVNFDPQNINLLLTKDPAQIKDIKNELLIRASLDPPSAWCNIFLAILNIRNGDIKSGVDYVEKACEISPGDKRIELYKYMLQWCKNIKDMELEVFIRESSDNELQAVYTLMVMGLYSDALRFLDSIKLTPKNSVEVFLLYAVSWDNSGNFDKALSYFQKAFNLSPDNIMVLYNMALCYKNHGIYDRAKDIIKRASRKDQSDFHFWYLYAEINYFLCDYEESLRFCNQALTIMPYHYDSWYLSGCVYNVLNDKEKALRSFEKALRIRPHSEYAKLKITAIYLDMKDYSKAEKIFGSVDNEFLKSDSDYNLLYACVTAAKGDAGLATDYLKKAIRFGKKECLKKMGRYDILKNLLSESEIKELLK